jgi:UDP-glucose 4-epimerase
MRCVVTGGLGFVGSQVARTLAAEGHEVLAVGRSAPDAWVRRLHEHVADRITYRRADLGRSGELADALRGETCDAIVHAAVVTATTAEVERDEALGIVNVNVNGTMEALDLARQTHCRRFVYVSSPSALGSVPADGPLDESAVPQPVTIYGITKLASELLVRRYAAVHGLSAVSVRIAQPYGPGERATPSRPRTSPIYEWLMAAERGTTLVTGPRSVVCDWTWVYDTARGLALLATAPEIRHDLYHLGCGVLTSVGTVIDLLRDAYPGLQTDERVDPDGLNPNIAGSSRRRPLDSGRFAAEFGWSPETSIRDGLTAYLRWHQAGSSTGG